MTIFIPLIAMILAIIGAYSLNLQLPHIWAPYLSLATIAAMDSVFGGIRSGMEGKFRSDVFVSGFISNTLFAAFLAWLGDRLGVDLYLAAVVALGGRILLNLSLIRRFYLNQWALKREKKSEPTQERT